MDWTNVKNETKLHLSKIQLKSLIGIKFYKMMMETIMHLVDNLDSERRPYLQNKAFSSFS